MVHFQANAHFRSQCRSNRNHTSLGERTAPNYLMTSCLTESCLMKGYSMKGYSMKGYSMENYSMESYSMENCSTMMNCLKAVSLGKAWLQALRSGDLPGESSHYPRVTHRGSRDYCESYHSRLPAIIAACYTIRLARDFSHLLRMWPVRTAPTSEVVRFR